jgi:LPS-assembly protein
MDSGIFLERNTLWAGQAMIHTLEPRLYYLYTPYREQSDIPLFDTGLPDFNFTQLFRNNRFTGADRIGDANQISAALTTRYFEKETGRERLRASIGRIYYFQDREVSLNNQTENAEHSDVVAEANATLAPQLTTRFDVRWNEESHQFDKGSILLQYMPETHSIFNIGYRYQESTLEQSDISLLWPLNRHWTIIGRHNFSLLDKRPLETLAGLEYQSCCWRIRIVNRRYVNDDLGETRENLYVQFELKGLTSQGDNLESVLENGILGYQD